MNLNLSDALHSLNDMAAGALSRLPYIVIAVLVFVGFHLLARLSRRLIRRFTEARRKHRNVGLVLGRLTEGGLMLVGVLVALVIAIPSFQPAQLIQILGISGVAIGFAFRDILQNFLAGILILLTEPFQIGDQIVVNGFEGTVEEIETRATLIRTYDGRRVVIPNSNLFTQSVTVNTAFQARRLQYDIVIGYGDDVTSARQVILDALRRLQNVATDPAPEALVIDLAGSSVNIRARWWITPPRQTDVVGSVDEALSAIKGALVAEGIDLPSPTRQVLFHDQTEETDGDRARQREGWPRRSAGLPLGRWRTWAAPGRPGGASRPRTARRPDRKCPDPAELAGRLGPSGTSRFVTIGSWLPILLPSGIVVVPEATSCAFNQFPGARRRR